MNSHIQEIIDRLRKDIETTKVENDPVKFIVVFEGGEIEKQTVTDENTLEAVLLATYVMLADMHMCSIEIKDTLYVLAPGYADVYHIQATEQEQVQCAECHLMVNKSDTVETVGVRVCENCLARIEQEQK